MQAARPAPASEPGSFWGLTLTWLPGGPRGRSRSCHPKHQRSNHHLAGTLLRWLFAKAVAASEGPDPSLSGGRVFLAAGR